MELGGRKGCRLHLLSIVCPSTFSFDCAVFLFYPQINKLQRREFSGRAGSPPKCSKVRQKIDYNLKLSDHLVSSAEQYGVALSAHFTHSSSFSLSMTSGFKPLLILHFYICLRQSCRRVSKCSERSSLILDHPINDSQATAQICVPESETWTVGAARLTQRGVCSLADPTVCGQQARAEGGERASSGRTLRRNRRVQVIHRRRRVFSCHHILFGHSGLKLHASGCRSSGRCRSKACQRQRASC